MVCFAAECRRIAQKYRRMYDKTAPPVKKKNSGYIMSTLGLNQ